MNLMVSSIPVHDPAYGLWSVVLLNVALFTVFAYGFFLPRTRHDWRVFGSFAAFLVALFAEMYGFPLTIYLSSAWLGRRFPALDPVTHESGHLWNVLIGWRGDPHLSPFHLSSAVLLAVGFVVLARAWPVLHESQRNGTIATTGPYSRVRHPQYLAFLLIMLGFLLQWPTIPTLVLFPVLAVMYVRLARREERDARARFGDAYADYAAVTPAFLPRLGRDSGRRFNVPPATPGVGDASHG